MKFEKPRILTDSEINTIRGKCLVGAATPSELMQAFGHFDLKEMELRSALGTLSRCFPAKVYVFGAYGENWSDSRPDTDEFEVVDFGKLLDS
jgi:hypothetical protein